MADTQVLGTCVFGRAGSSPASRTHLSRYLFQILSKPFNTMKNDMGLVSGNNIIADLMGKKVMFTPAEYESVIRKFNDRLFKNKMQDFDWE